VENPCFGRFVDAAKGSAHRRLNLLQGFRLGVGGVSRGERNDFFHQRAHHGFGSFVAQAISLRNLDALDGRFDAWHG